MWYPSFVLMCIFFKLSQLLNQLSDHTEIGTWSVFYGTKQQYKIWNPFSSYIWKPLGADKGMDGHIHIKAIPIQNFLQFGPFFSILNCILQFLFAFSIPLSFNICHTSPISRNLYLFPISTKPCQLSLLSVRSSSQTYFTSTFIYNSADGLVYPSTLSGEVLCDTLCLVWCVCVRPSLCPPPMVSRYNMRTDFVLLFGTIKHRSSSNFSVIR
jgi:hypothetical protein